MPEPALVVEARSVTKVYDQRVGGLRLRDATPGAARRPRRPLVALDHVDLEVAAGEAVGIIGPNGAGKSTLLKLVAGVSVPSTGAIRTTGRVASMIELELGFHPELTGRENVLCSAVMLGLDRRAARDLAPEIHAFSGLRDDALDQPLRTYSTGMRARLGFAVASHVHADVLVVDEVLTVGDREFQLKCLDRVAELVAAGTTLLFVSHAMDLVSAVCTRAVHLRRGALVDDGPAVEVVERYLSRSPSRHRRSEEAPATFLDCRLAPDLIAPWDPIRIEAEVEVHRAGTRLDASIELVVPIRVPPVTIATVSTPIPELAEVGRYRLLGTTSPMPLDQGRIRVLVGLADVGRHQLSDVAAAEVRIAGTPRSGNPYLRVVPTWSMAPTAPASTLRSIRAGLAAGTDVVATARGITKRFPSRDGLRRAALALPGRWARSVDEIVALDDVTIEVEAGSALGLIGANGAGKSTFLRVLAGVTRAEAGQVEVSGRVVPVLELGLGFHPDLTGEQNVRLSGRLLGMTEAEVEERLEAVFAMAVLGEVRDVEVKRYSTGMRARLGFALAMHAGGDLLLLDELLAVGDEDFRRQAIDTVRQRRDAGATVVFVSHQLRQVVDVCDRVVRLERGRVVDDGTPAEVVGRYGGPSWVAGARDAGSSVRLHELAIRPHHVPVGGRIELEGVLELGRPEPDVRIEVAYRAPLAGADDVVTGLDDALARSFFVATVVPPGGLTEPGWYRFSASIDDNLFAGAFDVVLTAIDERDDVIVAETWQPATVGPTRVEGFPGPVLEVEWQVERLDPVVVP